mgnify:CR=1 FL=1
MYITCLDLEGVLVPEIWIAFSEVSGIPELRRTTRDEPDYEKLMRWRMDILRQHGLGLRQIHRTDRPAARREGIFGRAARDDAGCHRQRHV